VTVVSAIQGAVTPASARVIARVTGSSTRLVYSTSQDLSSPSYEGPVTPAGGVARFDLSGLEADTRYFWAVEDDSVVDVAFPGEFVTYPPVGVPANFTVAAASCAGLAPVYPGSGTTFDSNRYSNSPVFGVIREKKPLLFQHMGDVHYLDIGSGTYTPDSSVATYRTAYDDVFAQSEQHALYRQVPLDYVWDDHDFGPNNSDRTHVGNGNANQVYRERIPHYPLGESGIYHSYQIGRVLFVTLDSRTFRDPNSDPDTPSKTMLGTDQKAWLGSLLATSTAKFLVVFNPSVWSHPDGADTWFSFQNEREELIQLFSDTGWIDRMVMVWGDRHALGMDTGTTIPGGFPIGQFAALDSTPSTAVLDRYDLGPESDQRGQYGTLDFVDSGSQIQVTMTGWIMTTVFQTYTYTIEVQDEPPEPGPVLPPPTEAVHRTSVTWLSCDAASGKIIDELPDLRGVPSRVLGEITSASLSLPRVLSGPAARQGLDAATEGGRVMIVPVVNDILPWGGLVLPTQVGTDTDNTLGCSSLEGYLGRRVAGDHEFVQQDEASVIASALFADAEAIDGVGRGLGLLIDAPPTGTPRDRSYVRKDRKSVFSQLEELMAILDGPEWTIDLEWADASQTTVAKIARVRKRIGVAASTPVVFEVTANSIFASQGGSDATYKYLTDYSDGKGANWIQAYGSGQGVDQPESDPAFDQGLFDAGWMIWERHFQPSSSIVDPEVLNDHAAAELARLRLGTRTWKITARWDVYPMLGVDWNIGDDVAWELIGHGHPLGVTGQGRVVGYQLDLQAGTVDLILAEE
jgi:hypothetical protein